MTRIDVIVVADFAWIEISIAAIARIGIDFATRTVGESRAIVFTF